MLGRLFTPEDFGLYNIFYSYIEVLIILSTCKYELAIVIADNDDEAARLTRLTLRLNAIISILLLTVGLILALTHTHLSSLPPQLYLLIPPMVFFCGTTRVYTFLFNRYKHYRQIATSEVVTSFGGTLLKILFGVLNSAFQFLHTLGMPLGTILGKVAGNIYYRIQIEKLKLKIEDTEQKIIGRSREISTFNFQLSTYKNFPLYAMPKELVSSFSANLPFIWLSIHFDNALIGLFGLALTLSMRPVGILANAFEKVFFASYSERVRQRQPLWRDTMRFVGVLNAVVIPVVVVAFFFAEPLFTFLFGDKWIGTGYYVRCIIPWLVVLLNANSLAFVANIFSTQRIDFFFQLTQLVLRLAALWIGIHAGNFQLAILLVCAVSTAVQLVQLGWYLLQLRRHDIKISTPL
ncbi:MAG: oligosaccharide flippase family protein [Bacteroidaceae bacterium]|nr:oligosaccharide flippase family protein [Bacteroidaceae bacterium]